MDDNALPKIAILGAGPIGLEAALYARYLGYCAEVFERGEGSTLNLHDGGESMLDGPFREHASPLGVAALAAQDTKWKCPAGSAMLTAAEYERAYLRPLAESDLIADSLHLGMEVQSLSRGEEDAWRINCRSHAGHDSVFTAEVLLDISGARSKLFVEANNERRAGSNNRAAQFSQSGRRFLCPREQKL